MPARLTGTSCRRRSLRRPRGNRLTRRRTVAWRGGRRGLRCRGWSRWRRSRRRGRLRRSGCGRNRPGNSRRSCRSSGSGRCNRFRRRRSVCRRSRSMRGRRMRGSRGSRFGNSGCMCSRRVCSRCMCCRRVRSGRMSNWCRRRGTLYLRLCRDFRRFRGSFRFGGSLQLMLDFLSYIHRDGARMSLFLGYAQARQKVNDGFCLDLQLAGQFVNSDLGWVTHAALGTFLFLLSLGRLLVLWFSRRGVSLRGGFLDFRFSGGFCHRFRRRF
jgi:hypothetical protein